MTDENGKSVDKIDMPVEYSGMTLRDWFAGQAMAGMVRESIKSADKDLYTAWIAGCAYDIADAMLKARGE